MLPVFRKVLLFRSFDERNFEEACVRRVDFCMKATLFLMWVLAYEFGTLSLFLEDRLVLVKSTGIESGLLFELFMRPLMVWAERLELLVFVSEVLRSLRLPGVTKPI